MTKNFVYNILFHLTLMQLVEISE